MTNLAFDVFWRDHGASQGMRNLSGDAKKAHGDVDGFKRAAAGLAGAFAVAEVTSFLKDSVRAASDLSEAGNKLQVTFGSASPAIVQWASTADKALGLSQLAAEDAAATFGVFAKSAGLAGTKAADFSTEMVGLAGDLASFYNTSPEDAIEAIGAALRGESEPIRRYGVLLDDATLRQQALKMGLIATTKQALTPQQRVLAAQAAILKQTGAAQGDFARTSGGLANQQRILAAEFENTKAELGQQLLPVVLQFVHALQEYGLPAVKGIAGALASVPPGAYAAAGGLVAVFGAVKAGTKVHEAYSESLKAGNKVIEYFAARAAAAAAAEAAQAAAAGGAAAAETAHAKASGAAAVATGEVAVASEGAAAAETSQAVAADAAAVSTGRLGLAAQGAGAMLGGLAAKAMLAGGIGGLAYLSAQVTSWQGTAEVTGVKTDELADALLHLSADAHAPKAALDAVTTSGERYWSSVETGTDVMRQFGALAKGAFGDGLQDIIGRAQTGSERMDRFAATASQLDAALTAMVQSGHAKEAAAFLARVKTESGLADGEFQHVTNHLPGYTAAIGSAGAATSTTAGAAKDLARSTAAAKAAADAHAKSLKDEIDRLTGATDAFLGARSAARAVKDAQDALTESLKNNSGGLNKNRSDFNLNTKAGRANAAALDAAADATRKDLQAKLDAGMPMLRFTQAVGRSRDALYREARQAGLNKEAAHRYADQILRVPTKQVTNFLQPGLAGARRAVDAVNSAIRHLGGKNVVISMNAAGNLVERIGSGPMKNKPLYSAAGGPVRGPGGPTQDAVPAMLSNGEHVMTASEVNAAGGHGAVTAWRRSLIGYAGGGPVVNVQARGRLGQQRGGLNAWENAMLLATGRAAGGGFSGPIPGGAGVARWAPLVLRALGIIGLPSSNLAVTLRRMNQESGGNPRAINLWDSNAKAGTPSKGLMQVIDPTFRAWHYPGTSSNIWDPLANILASMNYAWHVYGSLQSAYGRRGGYAKGTRSASPGWRWVGENGPELMRFRGGEQVLSNRMSAAAAGGGGIIVNVTIDGRLAGFEDRLVEGVRSATRHGRLSRAVLP